MTVTTNNENQIENNQTEVNNNIVLARPINGIPLNGLEFLRPPVPKVGEHIGYREFESKEAARAFIRAEVLPDSTDDQQNDYFTFMTVDEARKYEGVPKEMV